MWRTFDWSSGCQEWFEIRLFDHLLWLQDTDQVTWLTHEHRKALEDDELLDKVVEWFAERAQEYAEVYAYHQYDPDMDRGWYWVLRCGAINCELPEVIDSREMADFTVDDWLEWLEPYGTYRGEQQVQAGPKEPCLNPDLSDAAQERQRRWPKECRDCGTEFRPGRRNAARCPRCLGKARAKRRRRSGRRKGAV